MGLFDDVLAPKKKRDGLFADVLKDSGSTAGREILAQADALGLGKRPVLGSSVPVIRTPEQFSPPEETAIERDRRRARGMAGSVFAADVPTRTLGELASDTYDRGRIGVRGVAGGLVELANTPQHVINLVNSSANGYAQMLGAQARIPMLPSYDWVRGTQAVLDEESKAIREQMTPTAIRQGAEFESVDGVIPTLGYLATNPGEATGQLAEQAPQFLAAGLPGGVPVKLAGAGAFAGGQTGAQVGAENQARVKRGEITQAQADALTAQGVAGSAIVNSILPKIIPGGTVLEDALAGNKTGLTRGRGAALGLLGEGLTGGIEEAADQGLQNEATGKPVGEGVGKAFALGALLEGPVGAGAGFLSSGKPRTLGEIPPEELGAAARAAAPKSDAPQTSAIDPAILAAGNEALARAAKNAPPAPRDPAVAPEPTDDIDALLARNLPPDELPPAAPASASPSSEDAGAAATPEIDWQAAAEALGLTVQPAQAQDGFPSEGAGGSQPTPVQAPSVEAAIGQANPVEGGGLAGAGTAAAGAAEQASAAAGGDQAIPVAPDGFAPPPPTRFSAADMRQLVGWSQRGGEMVRAPVDDRLLNDEQRNGVVDQPKGEVIGRTRWTGWDGPDGQESTFWKNRPKGITEAQANAAFDKLERGEPLTAKEQRFIDYADAVAGEYDAAMNLLDDELRGYSEIERQRGIDELRQQHDIAVQEADQAEALSVYELAHRAASAGVDPFDIAQSANEQQPAYAARLWSLIQEAGRGTDNRAAEQDRAGSNRGRESRAQGAAEGFALTQQRAPGEGRAGGDVQGRSDLGDAYDGRQADQVSAGLFGAPTTADFIGAAKRARDASRNGLGRDLVRPEQGDGELLAGGRPAQADIAQERPNRDEGVPSNLLSARDAARDRSMAASAALDQFPRGRMGLTPDEVKATPEWKAAKREADAAMSAERAANKAVADARKQGQRGARPAQARVDEAGKPRQQAGRNGDDWLGEFFTPEAEAEMQERRRADEARRKAIAATLRAEADQARATAADWAGRKYKGNNKTIQFEGDGPGREFQSIGSINEARRHRVIQHRNESAAAIEALADRIERGDDAEIRAHIAEANTSKNLRDEAERDMFAGRPFGGGDTSGPKSIGGILRAAYAAPSQQQAGRPRDDIDVQRDEYEARRAETAKAAAGKAAITKRHRAERLAVLGEGWKVAGSEFPAKHTFKRKDGNRVVTVGEGRFAEGTFEVTPAVRHASGRWEHSGGGVRYFKDFAEAARYANESSKPAPTAAENVADTGFNSAALRAVDEASESRRRGEEEADLLELRDAVEAAVGPGRVEYLHDPSGLPDRLRKGVESRMQKRGGKGKTAALYDPVTKKVYLFTGTVTTPSRAVWHVLHEIAGHHGLREFLGDKLAPALEIALQNATVKRVAEAIAKERNIDMASQSGRLLAAEEALAELAAAVRTGNFDAITSRYKVEVPDGMRASVAKAVENFVKRLKKLLDDMFGRPMFTDEDVRGLLEAAWQAAQGDSAIGQPESALESTEDQTQSEAFNRWFGDSKVVDADGKPLVVYHGTTGNFDVFDMSRAGEVGDRFAEAAFFTSSPLVAGGYSQRLAADPEHAQLVKDEGDALRAWGKAVLAQYKATKTTDGPIANPVKAVVDGIQERRQNRRVAIFNNDVVTPGANIMPVYLSLQNPHVIDAKGENYYRVHGEAIAAAIKAGADGVIVRNVFDAANEVSREASDVFIAFRPEQIKSATGNNGNFDPDNPSILESVESTEPRVRRKRGEPMPSAERDANFRRWSNNAPLVTRDEAMGYAFKTGQKVVVEAIHGTKRPDRIGKGFNAKRATSGPMPYFTSDAVTGSSYATGKNDTSLSYEDQDFGAWFKVKVPGSRNPVSLDRAWHFLPSEVRSRIASLAPRISTDYETGENIELRPEGHANGIGNYDWEIKQAKGNALKALIEGWLSGGTLFDDEQRFMEVLEMAGMPMDAVTFDSPFAEYPALFPVYVRMNKPLVTNDIPQDVVDALNAAAKRDRSRAATGGADAWDKNTRTLRYWVATFNEDSSDAAYVWTSIPDKVTDVFRSLGYDGIVDMGGKGGGANHRVYIPFSEGQVKGKFNKGNFDDSKRDLLESVEYTPEQEASPFDKATATGASVLRDGRLLSLIDAVKAEGGDLSALTEAIKSRDVAALTRAIDAALAAMRPKPRVTGTKNAVTDAERMAAGRDPILREAVQSNEETVVRAMRELREDPTAGDEAVARLSRDGVEAISVADEAILLVHKTELLNKREAAAKKLADPNASEATKDVARQAWVEAEAKIAQLDLAASNAGREWGRFGQFRQRMMREDFTLAALERKERARLERPLTPEESATVKAMADQIAALQEKLDRLQERAKNAESEWAYETMTRRIERPRRAQDAISSLRQRADDARRRLRATPEVQGRNRQSGAIISPTVFADLATIGAYHVANGAAKLVDWVAAMRADVGDWFDGLKADHTNIFNAAKREAEQADRFDDTPADVLEKIDLGNIGPKDVRKLIAAHVGAGLRGESAVIEAAAKDLGLAEDEVRALFIQSVPRAEQSLTEAKQELADLRKLVRLQAEIDRLEAGLPKPKPGAAPRVDNPAVAERKRELAEVRKRLRPVRDPEGRYQEMRAKQIAKRIKELEARIADGDFAPRPRVPRALSDANQRAMFELDKAKEAFLRHQFEDNLRKRTPIGKAFGLVGDTFNLARAMMTSLDLSAILRQGGFIAYGHPLRAVSSIGPSLRAFVSEASEHALNTEITGRKNAPLYKKYGLQLTGIGAGPLTQIEEAYASRWLSKLPWWTGGGLVRGSGRAYTAFLNKLRADSFDAMAATLALRSVPTEAEGKAIANYINVATGRGKVGVKEQSAQALNTVFFAPRLVASRFQLLAGQPLYGGTSRTRKLVAQEYARFTIGVSVALALTAFALVGSDDDEDKPIIGLDPRSADFLKIRVGNTYIDPMAGLAQVTTFLAREITGETVTGKGEVKPLRTGYTLTDLRRSLGSDIPAHELGKDGRLPFGSGSAADVLGRFLRTKLAPAPGAIVNVLSGSNAIGEPVTPASAAVEMVTPMSFQNIADIMEEQGIPKGTAITTLGLLGMGVQHRLQSNAQQFAEFNDGIAAVRSDVKERLKSVPVERWPAEMEALRKEYGPAMDGLELQYYKADGKYGSAGEPRRDADGNPVLKSTRISDNYREVSGAGDDQQAHHVIPDNLARRHPLMAQARSMGYDLDRASNLLNMPKQAGGADIAHRTSHPDYDAEVFGLLQAAEKRLKKAHGSLKDAPASEVLDEVRKIEDEMRGRIQRKDVPTKDGRLAVLTSTPLGSA